MSARERDCGCARTMVYMRGSDSNQVSSLLHRQWVLGSERRTSVLAVSDFTCKAISPTPGAVWRKNRKGKWEVTTVKYLRRWCGH